MRTFRYPRDTRDPEPFAVEYEVAVTEKVAVPDLDGGPARMEERHTGQWEWASRVFHAHTSIPPGLAMAVNNVDPADPMGTVKQTRALHKLLRLGIVEADEFFALLDDPDIRLDQMIVNDVANLLVELAGNRPTALPRG